MAKNIKETREIDEAIGKLIKQARVSRGLSRQKLASKLQLSHQQIAKYEDASNRITASRLYLLATQLELPIDYFFTETIEKVKDDNHRMRLETAKGFMSMNASHLRIINILINEFNKG